MGKEIWLPVSGYENQYLISDHGNVYGLVRGKQLSLCEHPKGYLVVNLWLDGVACLKLVHRLVGFSFVANPNLYTQINHKNSNKKDNYYKNLEWCTGSQNVQHSIKSGTFKSAQRHFIG